MKSHPVLRCAREASERREAPTFQNKYAKLRNQEILSSNQKLVSTITRIESGKGSYNHQKIDRNLFKPCKTNKKFYDVQKQKLISDENEAS